MKYLNSKYIVTFFISAWMVSCVEKSPQGDATVNSYEADSGTIELTTAQIQTAGIMLGKIERRQISGTVKVNGVLDAPPQQMVSVSIPFGGFLKNTGLLQGSRVKKGQLIAVIENPEYIQIQQDYLEAISQFEFSNADYDRQKELAKENVNAQKAVQQAKSNYKSWLAKKNGLLAKLKMINIDLVSLEEGNITSTANIYSPISGYVTEVNVNIGKFVNPSDILFEIVDTEHLHVELTVFEKDIPKIKLGQKVRFVLANETSDRLATVHLIGREISVDRTIRIHCHIDKEDTDLLPGMYLKANVEISGSLATSLPDEAIIDFEGKKYIFVPMAGEGHNGRKFEMIEIESGNSELGYTEIAIPARLNEDTEVVIKGAYSILSKIKNSEEEDG
jgi:cobalt-zinc-cadmium efflux system membrane fusion protein